MRRAVEAFSRHRSSAQDSSRLRTLSSDSHVGHQCENRFMMMERKQLTKHTGTFSCISGSYVVIA